MWACEVVLFVFVIIVIFIFLNLNKWINKKQAYVWTKWANTCLLFTTTYNYLPKHTHTHARTDTVVLFSVTDGQDNWMLSHLGCSFPKCWSFLFYDPYTVLYLACLYSVSVKVCAQGCICACTKLVSYCVLVCMCTMATIGILLSVEMFCFFLDSCTALTLQLTPYFYPFIYSCNHCGALVLVCQMQMTTMFEWNSSSFPERVKESWAKMEGLLSSCMF